VVKSSDLRTTAHPQYAERNGISLEPVSWSCRLPIFIIVSLIVGIPYGLWFELGRHLRIEISPFLQFD
jgi:hypothetical protein